MTQNNTTQKSRLTERTTEPDLVAFYDIRPENGAGLFLQPRSPHGAVPAGGSRRCGGMLW